MRKLAATGSENHGLDWVEETLSSSCSTPLLWARTLPLDQVSPNLIPFSKNEQYRKVFRILSNHSHVHGPSTSDASLSATALTQRPLGAAPRDQLTRFPEFTATEKTEGQKTLIF